MLRSNFKFLSSAALLAAFLFTHQPASAQVRSGTIVGTVTDASGAPVPNAEVIVRETKTNSAVTLKSSSSGEYNAPYLGFGTYNISVKKAGFKQYSVTDVSLSTNQTVRVDLKLEIGAVESSITITGSALELQTESSRVVNTVSEEVIKAIPNINNNPLNYATLTQGVTARQSMNNSQNATSFGIGTDGRRALSNFSVNGGNSFTNDIQLDGVSIQASAWNEVAILPNTEGIQEVKTNVNNMSAEYGRSQGTVVFTTKSGTNEFHGSGQFRLRNEALNANSFGNNAQGITRAPFKVRNYSATFGGPIIIPKLYNGKDKTFFFVSYEGLRFNQALDYLRTVPTALERNGDFSQTRANVAGAFLPVQIFDPFNITSVGTNQWTRNPFPNAVIPASQVNPFTRRFVNEFPAANRDPQDPLLVTNNYYNRAIRGFERNALNSRFDHRMAKHSIYFTGGSNLASITSPNGWGDGTRAYTQQGGFIGPNYGDRNYYAAIGDTWVISPTLVADLRIGVTRVAADNRANTYQDIDFTQFGIPTAFNQTIGLQGAYPELNSFGGGFSQISGLNQTAYMAKIERQTNWNMVFSVTKTSGRWTHKWGGEYRNYLSNYSDARGSFNITTGNNFTSGNIIGPTANSINTVTGERNGSGLASYLLGAGSLQGGENAVLLALSAKYIAFYNQSDWRVTNRLTVNLGLRYDIQPSPTERYNRMSSFSYAGQTSGTPGRLYFPGVSGDRHLYRTNYRDFGPRFGAAWRVTDNMVIRAGAGVNFLPTNTGYYGGPYYYGNQNFFPVLSAPNALQYGSNPQGRLLAPFNQVNTVIPLIGANNDAPQYYGAGGNEPRFDRNDFQNSRVYQWNFFIERKFGKNYQVNAGYTGSRGSRLLIGRLGANSEQLFPDSQLQSWRQTYIATNGNNPATTPLVTNPYNPNGTILYNGNLRNANIPLREAVFPYPLFTGNLIGTNVGFSTYNAFMVNLQRSFSGGLLFNVHYTYSKSIDFSNPELQNNNFAENGGFGNGLVDRRNFGNSYFLSSNDIPHRLVATVVYNLPFGKGRKYDMQNKFINGVLGGWNIGNVLMLQSGQPQQGFGGCNSLTGLCDRVPGVDIEVPKNLQKWYDSPNPADRTVTLPSGRQITVGRFNFLKYNPDAFSGRTVQLPNGTIANDIYWFGNAAARYNDVRGVGYYNHNVSLQKDIPIWDRVNMTFSAEATNLWNRAQFTGTVNAGTGNIFIAPNASRGIQPGMIQNESFGTWGLATLDPRQIELRLRIRF